MKTVIQKKYICLPVNPLATTKKICFYKNVDGVRTLVMDIDCKLDVISPQFTMYDDVSRFMGDELEYESDPMMDFELSQSDSMELEGLWSEPYRPLSHFTPKIGWHNDPNGLIKYNGTYHMFFQYNPCGTEWGNMHWGHATSKDLIHWEEQDIALYPDDTGTMYSGSAIEDTKNVTGLGDGKTAPMLLFYTAAGDRNLLANGKKRTQCLAYSLDGGLTFEKYANNPVVPHIESHNRDPKVVWVDELDAFLLALYMADDRYGLFTSKNMLEWEMIQQVSIAAEWECPDIQSYELDGKRYWVLMGASDRYVVGTFEDGQFVRKSEEKQLTFGDGYAAQSFSGIDDGRVIRISWDKLRMPCQRSPMQMGIPVEMALERTDSGYFLKAVPVREIESLYEDTVEYNNVQTDLKARLEDSAYDISLSCDFDEDVSFCIFGHRFDVKKAENVIVRDKVKIPASLDGKKLDIRLIVDRCSVELYADGGRFCGVFLTVRDLNLPYFSVSGKEQVTVDKLKITKLGAIH